MFKAILAFIKTHVISTAITTTVVVGAAIATPIIVENYKLDKDVRENLGMLVSSNYKAPSDSNEIENDVMINDNEQIIENKSVNTNEPLTFRIEKVYHKTEGGSIVKDMQGNDAIEASSEGIEYKIVPSYDKDFSEWTKAEKEAYQKVLEETSKMAKEYYQKTALDEERKLTDVMQELERVNSKIETSYSKEYFLGWFPSSNNWSTSEAWRYNYYTKLYSGGSQENYGTVTKEFGNLEILSQGIQFTGITIENFRNKVYPILTQKIKQNLSEEEKEEALTQLNELYHLSD